MVIHGKSTSCDLKVAEGKIWVVFAFVNQKGKYEVHQCSGSKTIKAPASWGMNRAAMKYNTSMTKEFEVLGKLLTIKNLPHYAVSVHETGMLSSALRAFNGLHIDQDYGLYKLSIDENQKVENAQVISGFTKELDDKLIRILQSRTQWRVK